MPKVGMQPVRRAQLIDATLKCVDQSGLAGTTISKVSRIAGLSTGIISHYFGGKSQLLEAAMRELLKQLGHGVVSRKQAATTPKEQLLAIINGNFSFEQTRSASVSTWLAFWAEAMHEPSLARLQRVNMNRLRSNLRFTLKQLLPQEKALLVADGLAALIDGLWLRGTFEQGGFDTDKARAICIEYIEVHLLTQP